MSITGAYVGALVAIFIFLATNLGVLIWFMSKVTTTLEFLQEEIKNLCDRMAGHDADKYTKEDAARDLSIRDQQIEAIWKKIDLLHRG